MEPNVCWAKVESGAQRSEVKPKCPRIRPRLSTVDLASQETVVAPVKPENWGEPAEQEEQWTIAEPRIWKAKVEKVGRPGQSCRTGGACCRFGDPRWNQRIKLDPGDWKKKVELVGMRTTLEPK